MSRPPLQSRPSRTRGPRVMREVSSRSWSSSQTERGYIPDETAVANHPFSNRRAVYTHPSLVNPRILAESAICRLTMGRIGVDLAPEEA